MHFYRSLAPIKAITFDLDDTLYDNSMVVEAAEDALIKTLQSYDALRDLTLEKFNSEKQRVLNNNHEIYHDVIEWRIKTIDAILQKKQFPQITIPSIIDAAMNSFVTWRHKIAIPSTSYELLAYLANKYPLAVISNGNVEIDRIGMGDYFQFALRGGADGRSKPFPEIFQLASEKLAIPIGQILHVGDSLLADVDGALLSGMQSCWLNITHHDIKHLSDARRLPHIAITQLSELYNLL